MRPPPPTPQPREDFSDLRVLVADPGDDFVAIATKAILRKLPGATIVTARTGQEALDALLGSPIDIVLIDIGLPVVSGAEVMARARREGKRPFLILTSGIVVPHWAVLSTELHAYEFIKKPFLPEDLETLLGAYARMRNPTSVLIADGNDHTRGMVRKIVSSARFATDIQETDNGGYALKLARIRPFELALVDAYVQGLSGLETACQLQSQHPNMMVVSILPLNDRTISQSLKHLGLAHSLQKPFFTRDIDVLMHVLHDLRRPYLMNAVLKAAAQMAS